jgi:hypothetical protein
MCVIWTTDPIALLIAVLCFEEIPAAGARQLDIQLHSPYRG